MLIAVDAAGGDYAPHEIVKGAIKAAQEYKVDIALVGRRRILRVLANRYKKADFTIVNANQVIGYRESPIKAVLSKPNSSIVVGINLVRDGTASAFVSAGNTGAILCASLLNLKKIEGIERPAIVGLINITPTTPVLLIDSGANVDCRPSHLVQFAQLGAIYAKEVFGINSPRVGLLNNGQEETKGNRLAKETYPLLKKTKLNFIGNIEGQDIIKQVADVIVTDGFTGNIVLKTLEGLGDTFLDSVRKVGNIFSSVYHLQMRTFFRDIGLGSWVKGMDYREYGGASLLGVNGNIVIAHGRSQARAIKNAIGLAKVTAERDIPKIIKEVNHG